MKCRQCGTDIADKALICFRCGTATTEATFKAPPPPRTPSRPMLIASVLALALLVLLATYMGRVTTGGVPRAVAWAAAAVAVVMIVLRAIARRR